MRIRIKNSCPKMVLCQYPHDSQQCALTISSISATSSELQFEWFSRKEDAIRFDDNLQLPQFILTGSSLHECKANRKSGNYSCIETRLKLRRDVRFHMAQTYIPTSICVIFSWISVWLPEEFVEGRIFVSLTVFLTLSAENSSAKEVLPKVSYIKAIDYWFGWTSSFVFFTMMEGLLVIYLESFSRRLKKDADSVLESSRYEATKLLHKSAKYHKWARKIDSLCKVMYPVTFLIFLMIYNFVITEGEEDKCLRKSFE